MESIMCVCDVTAWPGYVLFKLEKGEECVRGGLEECQPLDWISMNSKEADRGDGGEESGEKEKTHQTRCGELFG